MRAREFIVEESADRLQQAISQQISTIYDIDELNKIHSYIKRLDIGSGFEELFKRDIDLKQVQGYLSKAIMEAPGTVDQKIGFARELVGSGIIDIDALMVPNKNLNIMNAVVTNYPEIFQSIAPALINISGQFASGKYRTQKGKGEFFLALCSPKINLSKSAGDIMIGDFLAEVKTDLARIKGRSGYGTTDSAIKEVSSAVTKFLTQKLGKSQVPIKQFTVHLGGQADLWDKFGPYCQESGINLVEVRSFLVQQLERIVLSLYINLDRENLDFLSSSINDQAVMDKKLFVERLKIVAFNYYQSSDKFDGILLLKTDSLDYILCSTAEAFAQSIRVAKWGFEQGQQNGLQIKL